MLLSVLRRPFKFSSSSASAHGQVFRIGNDFEATYTPMRKSHPPSPAFLYCKGQNCLHFSDGFTMHVLASARATIVSTSVLC
jgi:hypothetical protein